MRDGIIPRFGPRFSSKASAAELFFYLSPLPSSVYFAYKPFSFSSSPSQASVPFLFHLEDSRLFFLLSLFLSYFFVFGETMSQFPSSFSHIPREACQERFGRYFVASKNYQLRGIHHLNFLIIIYSPIMFISQQGGTYLIILTISPNQIRPLTPIPL